MKKRKVLIVFVDMIADMESNNKLSFKVTEFVLKETENSTFHLFL